MTDFEIAELFEVFVPTVKNHIHTILKSNVVTADFSNGATWIGHNILPTVIKTVDKNLKNKVNK